MTNIEQFESVFRAAAKEPFASRDIKIESALVVTDRDEADARDFGDRVSGFLRNALGHEVRWDVLAGKDIGDVEQLIKVVRTRACDLVCTYRNLFSEAWKYPYSLGEHLDVLTQHTPVPVLVTPHPDADRASAHALEDTNRVMAVTNHLAGEHRLVNTAAAFTQGNGCLTLAHIEDDADFDRIIEAISKIPSIDTDDARKALSAQLLKEPRDYIESCRKGLSTGSKRIKVEGVVEFGHRISQITRVVEDQKVDLLVFNTVDEGQLAMHGLAHSLAVEVRRIPILML